MPSLQCLTVRTEDITQVPFKPFLEKLSYKIGHPGDCERIKTSFPSKAFVLFGVLWVL